MANDKKAAPKPGAHVVVSPFRDKNNFDLAYTVGQDVSDLGESRLSELVTAGLVEVVKAEVPPAKQPPAPPAPTPPAPTPEVPKLPEVPPAA